MKKSCDKMNNDIYEQLTDALDKLPNGFPRTPSKVEIKILKKIFSPEEALLASHRKVEFMSGVARLVSRRRGASSATPAQRKASFATQGSRIYEWSSETCLAKTQSKLCYSSPAQSKLRYTGK